MRILSIVFFFHFFKNSYAWSLFAPKNFHECILENMKGVTSDDAAGAIMYACRKTFPIEKTDNNFSWSITSMKTCSKN